MIDGIYELGRKIGKKRHDYDLLRADDLFNPIPDEVLERIVNGVEEFEKIDGLLFTHYHVDHFSCEKTIQCLAKNKIGSIFLPHDQHPKIIAVKEQAEKSETTLFNMNLPLGVKEEHIVQDIRIQYFKAKHSGKEFSHVEHYCFLISVYDKTVYISGDADYIDSYQQKMLEGVNVTVGFFNPLYFHQRTGRHLMKHINPQKVIMYHVPLEKDDKYGFRKLSKRIAERFAENLPPYEIVSEEMQAFLI